MLKKLFVVTLAWAAGSLSAAEYYVATNGLPSGNGSKERPWDFQSAIGRGSPARGGDTIWMRGGIYLGNYTSYLGGSANNHLALRGYPDERAIIDGANAGQFPLVVDGAWTIYRDFEVTQTSTSVPGASQPVAIQCVAPNVKLVNLVIHDGGQGIGSWMGAVNSEIYGCIIYNNGAKSLEHGIYAQNDAQTGTKRIHDNIIFNNSGFGIHAYTQGGKISGFDFQGNIAFNNGSKSGDSTRYENIFVGGVPPSDQLNVVSNYTFTTIGLSRFNVRFSYQNHQDEPQGKITVGNNYFVGGTGFTADDWRQIVFTNNVVASPSPLVHCWPAPGVPFQAYDWNRNTYHGSSSFGVGPANYNFANWRSTTGFDAASSHSTAMPPSNRVFVRANKFQAKRAHIAVYNWEQKPRVEVDVRGVLVAGDAYEVRNAQDYFGPPVASGIYNGVAISVPTTNLAVALPRGRAVGPLPTGPLFNAFVLVPGQRSSPAPRVAAIIPSKNGRAHIHGTGAPNVAWALQASTDLTNWLTIGTTSATSNGVLQFEDTGFGLFRSRFYRFVRL